MGQLFKRKNTLGFSLVEVTIAMALVSIVSVAVFQLSGLSKKDSLAMNLSRLASDQRHRILTHVKNPVSWQNTSNYNSSFSCFAPASSCNLNTAAGSLGYYDFIILDSDSSAVQKLTYDDADPTTRLSLNSPQCEAGVVNPSPICPLKYKARWRPICQTYPCVNPQLEIRIDLTYDYPSEVPFNSNKYSIKIIRDFRDSSIQSACEALNGSFNATTGICTPLYANQTCPPYQVVSGINSDGTIVCKALYKGQCNAATQLVLGVNSSGQVQCGVRPACAVIPPPPPPPPPPSGDSCSRVICHLNKSYSCTRTNGVGSPLIHISSGCTDEDGGSNPCMLINCGAP